MSEPKKHHYVPRAYLRFFAQENKPGIYQIAVFDKISGRSYASNIDNVAEEKNYNRVEIDRFNMSVPNKDPLFYERLYPQIIEDKIPTIIQRSISAFTLTNAGTPAIADNLKADLAKMLAIQTMRTPRNRTFFYDICRVPFYATKKRVIDYLATNPSNRDWHNEIEQLQEFDYTNEFAKSAILSLTTQEDRIARFSDVLISGYYWVVFSNRLLNSLPFFTSDEPVLFTDIYRRNVGLERNPLLWPNTIIHFALNSQYMLVLYNKASPHSIEIANYADQCVNVDNAKCITLLNSLQLEQCTRQVFTNPRFLDLLHRFYAPNQD